MTSPAANDARSARDGHRRDDRGWTVLMSRMLDFYARLGWPPI